MAHKRRLSWTAQGATYLIATLGVELGTRLVLSHSDAVYAYADISSWWCGLIVAYILAISWPLAAAMIPLLGLIDYLAIAQGVRYHDPPQGPALFMLISFRAVFAVSPIVVAVIARRVLMRLGLVDQ
jgi:hypothetical protein